MKIRLRIISAALLLIALTACVGTNANDVRVKCPACGYEFDVETQG